MDDKECRSCKTRIFVRKDRSICLGKKKQKGRLKDW